MQWIEPGSVICKSSDLPSVLLLQLQDLKFSSSEFFWAILHAVFFNNPLSLYFLGTMVFYLFRDTLAILLGFELWAWRLLPLVLRVLCASSYHSEVGWVVRQVP